MDMKICHRAFNLHSKVVSAPYEVLIVGPEIDTAYDLCDEETELLIKWLEEKPRKTLSLKDKGNTTPE